MFLKARRPSNSTGIQGSELGFNRETDLIKGRVEVVVGGNKGWEKSRTGLKRGLEEGLGLGLKGKEHGIYLGDLNS